MVLLQVFIQFEVFNVPEMRVRDKEQNITETGMNAA
jgi:hypothetical protein